MFKHGVNYQRLSDSQTVEEKIRQSYRKQGNIRYGEHKAYTCLGVRSKNSLEDYLRKVQNFITLAKKSENQLVLTLEIESFALRRKLSQQLQAIYKVTNEIYTTFNRRSPNFEIIFQKPRPEPSSKEESKEKQHYKKQKVTEADCELSDYDRVIGGQRDGYNVVYEDDRCIAIQATSDQLKVHLEVVAKASNNQSLEKSSPELVGHIMLVAKNLAAKMNLENGYRIIVD